MAHGNATVNATIAKQICDGTTSMILGGTDGGIILPLGGPSEGDWPRGVKVVLYLMGLLWCFLGVGIIADIFMGAIEKITSSRKRVYNKKAGKTVTVKVWNDTVANLSLMALGSSAPEILLSVIELCAINPIMHSGDLGPSTIVGSAAFNLLCISAVCVSALPDGEVRIIKDTGVFAVTASFSIFAYVWLLIILLLITPDVVEVWEGALTFLFFPILLVIAYAADVGWLPGTSKPEPSSCVHAESTKEELAQMELNVRQKYGRNHNLTPDQVAALMTYEYEKPPSRAVNRMAATRMMMGGPAIGESSWMKGKRLSCELMARLSTSRSQVMDKPSVGFNALNYTVLESVGTVDIYVERSSVRKDEKLEVKYITQDGTAKKGSDFVFAAGTLTFAPGELLKSIQVQIVKSDVYEETEEFYVDLDASKIGNDPVDNTLLNQDHKRVTVVIIDEDSPGQLKFERETMRFPDKGDANEKKAVDLQEINDVKVEVEGEPKPEDNKLKVTVIRHKGSSGEVSCKYKTRDGSAIQGADYKYAEGLLTFKPGQMSSYFYVEILPNNVYEANDEDFIIELTDPTGGARFDNTTDGGSATCIMTVTITADRNQPRIDRVWGALVNMDKVKAGNTNWKKQFVEACFVGGSLEEQRQAIENKQFLDVVFHIASLPWKLLFAVVPPTDFCGGWLSFCIALIMIGIVTAVIGDMAMLLGCALTICDAITAITFVAMGTSLPDTFASKAAAQNDETADNSIGNITGSNSVNVFLGLGLPWFIGSIYWELMKSDPPHESWTSRAKEMGWKELGIVDANPRGAFVVKAGALGSSVAIFTVCAVCCIGTLIARRKFLGGELGGNKRSCYVTSGFFVSLWFIYIILSIVIGGCPEWSDDE